MPQLVIVRKDNQSFYLNFNGVEVKIKCWRDRCGRQKYGVEAPHEVLVYREEIRDDVLKDLHAAGLPVPEDYLRGLSGGEYRPEVSGLPGHGEGQQGTPVPPVSNPREDCYYGDQDR